MAVRRNPGHIEPEAATPTRAELIAGLLRALVVCPPKLCTKPSAVGVVPLGRALRQDEVRASPWRRSVVCSDRWSRAAQRGEALPGTR